ncbi:Matrix metalloproteinase-16, partial [Ooceraea biroi]
TTTPATTTTTALPEPPDPCTWRDIDTLLVLGKRLFITQGQYAWSIGLGGKIVDRPFFLRDYVRFLPKTVTRLLAAYQTVKGDLVLFADGWVYMVSYPTLELRASWPRRITDLGLPPNAVINAALNSHTGRTYVIYNDYAVLEMDECIMMARGYHTLQTVFPGIPSSVRTAYRYTDGHLYFIHRDRFFAYNEFTETVTSRRYNLIRTGYKYLEIGIGVPPTLDTATLHVAMGDTTGKKILLNAEMWKGLVDSRAIVCDYLARANGEHVNAHPPMRMDDLTIRFASINGQPTIRLDTPTGRLTLSAPTVPYLYGLRHCAERVIATMASVVGQVEAKLRAFKHAAAGVEDPSDAPRAIRDSKDFDNNDLLDCELLVVVFGNI